MSAIEALLGCAPEPPPGRPPVNPRTLLLDGVMIHLAEDESTEEVVIYSLLGTMQPAAWLAADEHAHGWSHAVPLGSDERATSILSIDPGTRKAFLSDVWPRPALDTVTFDKHLNGHARRHRQWAHALQIHAESEIR
jgi:hypothetical protein